MTLLSNGEPEAVPSPFESLQRVHIAELAPTSDAHDASYIQGEIVLIWPYSSSNHILSVLVAERDARQRHSRGQVKVTFIGPGAKEVASTRLGIGDSIRLAVKGSRWIETGHAVSTPGRKIAWDLQYEQRVLLEIEQDEGSSKVVDFTQPVVPQRSSLSPPRDAVEQLKGRSGLLTDGDAIEIPSPAFIQYTRFSAGSFIDASLDPFAEDDGFVLGKGRKRTKFSRPSGAWRFLDDSDSLEEAAVIQDASEGDAVVAPPERVHDETAIADVTFAEPLQATEITDAEATDAEVTAHMSVNVEEIELSAPFEPAPEHAQAEVVDDSATMLPPITTPQQPLQRRLHQLPALEVITQPDSQQQITPRLHPIASPALPLVSPLVHRSEGARSLLQFTSLESELDASGKSNVDEIPEHVARGRRKQPPDVISLISPDDGIASASGSYHQQITVSEHVHQLDLHETVADPGITDQQIVHIEDDDMYGAKSPPSAMNIPPPSTFQPPVFIPDMNAGSVQPTLETQELEMELGRKPLFTSNLEDMGTSMTAEPDAEGRLRPSDVQDRRDLLVGAATMPAQSLDGVVDNHARTFYEEDSEHVAVAFEKSDEPEATNLDPAIVHAEIVSDLEHNVPAAALPPVVQSVEASPPAVVNSTMLLRSGRVKEESPAKSRTQTPVSARSRVPSTEPNQLLTPDHTQNEAMEPLVSNLQKPVEVEMPPTPQNTQDLAFSKSDQPVPDSDPRISPEPETAAQPQLPELLPDHDPPSSRRTSRRLRMSLPLENISQISSPYFTPKGSNRMRTYQQPSSPTRKENIRPTSSPRNHTPLLPTTLPAILEKPLGVVHKLPDLLSKVARTYALSTPSSYYAPLATVSEFFSSSIDVLAVCTSANEIHQAESGPQDSYCTLQLADPSMSDHNILVAQIFRPRKDALPAAQRGSVVLLRNMKVQSQKRKPMLLSTNSSAWAVFSHPNHTYTEASMLSVTVAGPPVEYGPTEKRAAMDLMKWWDNEGSARHPATKHKAVAELSMEDTIEPRERRRGSFQNESDAITAAENRGTNATRSATLDLEAEVDGVSGDLWTRRRSRRKANHTDNIGNEADMSPVDVAKRHNRRQSDASMISQKSRTSLNRRGFAGRRSESLVHELRDGTTYVDDEVDVERRRRSGSLVHELRDGTHYIDD